MRLKLIIGILALLLLMVGTASAETFYLTKTDNNVTGINISVTVTSSYIYVQDISPALENTPKVDIKAIGLTIDDSYINGPIVDTSGNTTGWDHKIADGYNNKAGFGEFNTSVYSNDPKFTRGPIRIPISSSALPLPKNELGNSVVVHLSYGTQLLDVSKQEYVGSGWVSGGDTQIPEFPTVALPVAAILGLMFIFGRKKQE